MTFDYAEELIRENARKNHVQLTNFYMIGDNPVSDIKGGNMKGWTTILVKTGVFKTDAKTSVNGNDKENPATVVVEDFDAALKYIFSKENLPY